MAKASAKKTATKQKKSAKDSPSQRFEQIFKNVDGLLRKDSGCTGELDYTEQSSWLLFLKYLDALEKDRKVEAELDGEQFVPILDEKYRWSHWAAPRNAAGEIDYNAAKTGPDLLDFVNEELFPYLKSFKQTAATNSSIEYKIGEIFDEVRNRVASGYNLREVIDELDKLNFRSQDQKHELSDLYEVKIRRMGNAGRNGGEYYTPRPLIRAIIEVVDPQIGETIYDPALGSAGFLCEAFEYLQARADTVDKRQILQERTFYGKEKKSLAYVIGIMNMILHGIEAPNVLHTNTLSENVQQIQEKDRYNIVLANPPFGGREREEVQQNFPIRSSETAYLFMQHFIKSLKVNGRAGIVIKNTFLSNTDNASVALRRELLETCNLHTILDLPSGVFQGAGVKTVALFFEKGKKTDDIWYYQLEPGRNLGKSDPLNDADMSDFLSLVSDRATSAQSWRLSAAEVDSTSFDLTVRNPSAEGPAELAAPAELLQSLESLLDEEAMILKQIREGLS